MVSIFAARYEGSVVYLTSRGGAVGSSLGSGIVLLDLSTMLTKQKGDIAEQAVTLYALKRGWRVLNPVGDYLPYDLVLDINGQFVKIQVKFAWFDEKTENYVVDNRRTKTNRREMVRSNYSLADFDFAILYIDELNVFYIMPCNVFVSYGSGIHLIESDKRQRKPRSAAYREAWNLIELWAASEETPG